MTSPGLQDVGHATVANRTAKGSICHISALFAEIKAHHFQDAANLGCLLLFVQQAFGHPLNRKTNPYSSHHLQRSESSVADASLSVQKDLLNEDKCPSSLKELFRLPSAKE